MCRECTVDPFAVFSAEEKIDQSVGRLYHHRLAEYYTKPKLWNLAKDTRDGKFLELDLTYNSLYHWYILANGRKMHLCCPRAEHRDWFRQNWKVHRYPFTYLNCVST